MSGTSLRESLRPEEWLASKVKKSRDLGSIAMFNDGDLMRIDSRIHFGLDMYICFRECCFTSTTTFESNFDNEGTLRGGSHTHYSMPNLRSKNGSLE